MQCVQHFSSCACAQRLHCDCLQGVQHFKDIQYTPSMTYGELFMQNEYEMSRYNLDEANVDGQRQRFDLYQQVQLPCCDDCP